MIIIMIIMMIIMIIILLSSLFPEGGGGGPWARGPSDARELPAAGEVPFAYISMSREFSLI